MRGLVWVSQEGLAWGVPPLPLSAFLFWLLVTEKVALKQKSFERILDCSYITGLA